MAHSDVLKLPVLQASSEAQVQLPLPEFLALRDYAIEQATKVDCLEQELIDYRKLLQGLLFFKPEDGIDPTYTVVLDGARFTELVQHILCCELDMPITADTMHVIPGEAINISFWDMSIRLGQIQRELGFAELFKTSYERRFVNRNEEEREHV